MALALIIDFIIAIYAKANVGGDAIYHMSRIVDILSNGFNIQTSFFNNLPDGAYHYNVMYALYSVPSKIFHLEPFRVWEYSLSFYRLLLLAAIFTISMHIFDKWLKAGKLALPLSFLSVLSAIAFNGYDFYIATYPSRVAYIWLILLVISLSYKTRKFTREIGLIIVSVGFILTMTHPSYALVAAGFIIILGLVRLIFENREFINDKITILFYILTVTILMVGPLVTKFSPSRLSENQFRLNEPPLLNVFGMEMIPLNNIFFAVDYVSTLLLLASVPAVVFLLRKLWKSKLEWSVAFSVLFIFVIITKVPFVFSALHAVLPVWVIERFDEMNVLRYIYFTLGLYGIFYVINRECAREGLRRDQSRRLGLLTVSYALIVLLVSASVGIKTFNLFLLQREQRVGSYNTMERTHQELSDILSNKKLIVSGVDYTYYLNALFPIDVVAVEIGHSPQAADAENRIACQEYIMKHFKFEDLKVAGVDYVLLPVYSGYKPESDIALNRPYLKLIRKSQDFFVYEFKKEYSAVNASPYKPCLLYQQNEKK